MVGELLQGMVNELRDPNDASDPLSTVGRFIGTGIDMAAMGAAVEVVGGIDGGVSMGPAPVAQPQPALDNTLNAAPMTPPTPGMGS